MAELVPVDNDPFASAAPSVQPQLVPVEHDPFAAAPQTEAYYGSGKRKAGTAPWQVNDGPDATWGDVGKVVHHGFSGFNSAAGKLLFAPSDALNAGIDKITSMLGFEPSTGRSAHEAYNNTFVNAGEPTTEMQRVAAAGGDMAAQNLAFLVPGLGAASTIARSAVPMVERTAPSLANTIRGAAERVGTQMAEHPTATFAGDTGMAALSGSGGEVARSAAEDAGASPTGQMGATLAGQFLAPSLAVTYSKFAPTVMASKLAAKGTKAAVGAVPDSVLPESWKPTTGTFADRAAEQSAYANREGQYADPSVPAPPAPDWITQIRDQGATARTEKAKTAVAGDMQDVLRNPETAANYAEAQRVQEQIPGFVPGVAKATGDPELLNLQRNIEAGSSGNDLRTAQQHVSQNAGAIRQFADEAVPTAGANPEDAVAKAVQNRVTAIQSRLGGQQNATEGQIRQTSETLPEVDPTVTGNQMRQVRSAEQAAADAETTRLRKAIAQPDTPITVGGNPTTVNAALDRRAQINGDLRDYYGATSRNVEDTRAMRALQAERNQLDTAIEGVNLPGMQEYRSYYRDEYAPRFLEGASAQVGQYKSTGYGHNAVADENVAGKFFGPNNISGARQWNSIYGEVPQMRQQMADTALDDLRRTAVDPSTGLIKEGAVSRWLAKNERVLNEMPWVREAVSAKNPDELYARLGQLEQRQRGVANGIISQVLGKEPGAAIDRALSDWRVARTVKNSVRGDPQADAALTRAVWDRVIASGGDDALLDAGKMQSFIDKNRRSLGVVLTPEHLASLDTIIRAASIEGRLGAPTGTPSVPKSILGKFGEWFGTSIPSLSSAGLSVVRGRSNVFQEAGNVALRAMNKLTQAEVVAAWKEALYNPKIAADLAGIATAGKANPQQQQRLLNYLLTVGAVDTGQGVRPDQKKETP